MSRNNLRIGTISFLNARPLTYGIADYRQIDISYEAPSQLAKGLETARFDIALIPAIDYQTIDHTWQIIPTNAIGSDGPVLTARIFSQEPLGKMELLSCDPDSHTAVALAKVIWQLRFHKRLAVEPLAKDKPIENHQAVLLIGDKVIHEQHPWPYQLDLGAAWTELTLLPFVFAFWAGRPEADLGLAYHLLTRLYEKARHHLPQIADQFASRHGFAADLARHYLATNLCYDFGIRQQRGLLRFYEFAAQFHIIAQPRPLRFFFPDPKAPVPQLG